MTIDGQLAEDISRFYDDPLGFVLYAFPWQQPGLLEKHDGPDNWQRDFLARLGEEVRARKFNGHDPVAPVRMAVASGHGVGKSALTAWLILWIMSTRPRARGTVTATSFPQLSARTWAQLQLWAGLCVTKRWFNVTSDSIYFRGQKATWATYAQSCKAENSESFAGQHAQDSSSFYVFDEASGVPEQIFDVAEGGLTDGEPMIFFFGNPTKIEGKFFRACFGDERERWIHWSVDSRDSRFTNKEELARWREQRGGEEDDFVRVRVRGLPPLRGSFNELIPAHAVAACQQYRSEAHKSLPKILACDPARFGDDLSAIGLRQGRQFRIIAKLSQIDLVQVAYRIIEAIKSEEPDAVVIDGDGLGAGVVDLVKNLGYGKKLHEFRGGMTAQDRKQYANQRAEVWCAMRDWITAGAEIPSDPSLYTDLTALQYGYTRLGQIQLESKADLKARGFHSPDLGDCLAMTFAVPVRQYAPDDDWDFWSRYSYRMPGEFEFMA